MTISVGDSLPDVTLLQIGENGPEPVSLGDKLKGRKVVMFAVPGAYTPTCHSAHVPSFMRVMDGLKDKGVDEVICVSVNDPWVLAHWGQSTGATEAGITMLSDATSELAKAIGMVFTAEPAGLIDRSVRYALMAEDSVVKVWHPETGRGTCEISGGEAMLAAL